MYKVFDYFLEVETWYKSHPCDEERFYQALRKVVKRKYFSPDKMAEYMIQKKKLDRNADDQHLVQVIDRLCANAWAVKTYLKTKNAPSAIIAKYF